VAKIALDYRQGNIDPLMKESKNNRDAAERIYEKIKGQMTDEKTAYLEDEEERLSEIYTKRLNNQKEGEVTYSGNLYEDYRLLETYLAGQYRYMQEYEDYSRQLKELAEENIDYYKAAGNKKKQAENEFIREQYQNRSISAFYRMDVAESFLSYNFSIILILFLCVLAITPIFFIEKETRMQDILLTAKAGRRRSSIVKVCGALLFSACMVIWFSLIDFLSFLLICKMEGLDMPIWSIESMKNCFLNCSVGYFAGLKFEAELLAFFVAALILLLLSRVFALQRRKSGK
jgi:hypothetical protein